MSEEDVKALHALGEDVKGAVRWLSRDDGVEANMRLVNAAMLLTRVGLRIEKMIGDAEEATCTVPEAAPGECQIEGCAEHGTFGKAFDYTGPTVKITAEERLIGTLIDNTCLVPLLADLVAGDFDDPLMGALLHAIRSYARLYGDSTALSRGWLFTSVSEGNQALAADLIRRGPGYLDSLAANRMPLPLFRETADMFRRSVARMNPSRNIRAVG